MTVKAKTKNVGISVKKLRPYVNLIRGKKAIDALNILAFMNSSSSETLIELIKSAIANAENNNQFDIDNLYVKEAYVGKSLVMKRFRPRAKGRAAPILKPYSSVTIILSENKQMEKHGSKS